MRGHIFWVQGIQRLVASALLVTIGLAAATFTHLGSESGSVSSRTYEKRTSAQTSADWTRFGGYTDYAPAGVPDFDQRRPRWRSNREDESRDRSWTHDGAVTAAAALWWLDSRLEPGESPPPARSDGSHIVRALGAWDDHSPENIAPLVENLALAADTNGSAGETLPYYGTCLDRLVEALDEHLESVPGQRFVARTLWSPSTDQLEDEIVAGHPMIALLGLWQQYLPGAGDWARVGGHYVSLQAVDSRLDLIKISDPFKDLETGGGSEPDDHDDAGTVSHDAYLVTPSLRPGEKPVLRVDGYLGGPGTRESILDNFQNHNRGPCDRSDAPWLPIVRQEAHLDAVIIIEEAPPPTETPTATPSATATATAPVTRTATPVEGTVTPLAVTPEPTIDPGATEPTPSPSPSGTGQATSQTPGTPVAPAPSSTTSPTPPSAEPTEEGSPAATSAVPTAGSSTATTPGATSPASGTVTPSTVPPGTAEATANATADLPGTATPTNSGPTATAASATGTARAAASATAASAPMTATPLPGGGSPPPDATPVSTQETTPVATATGEPSTPSGPGATATSSPSGSPPPTAHPDVTLTPGGTAAAPTPSSGPPTSTPETGAVSTPIPTSSTTLLEEAICGLVTSAHDGTPISNAAVWLQRRIDGEWRDVLQTQPSDHVGSFCFHRVPAGRYRLIADRPGCNRAIAPALHDPPSAPARALLTLACRNNSLYLPSAHQQAQIP